MSRHMSPSASSRSGPVRTVQRSGFSLPSDTERIDRLASVLHVLYLMFNEGYATSSGPSLARTDLSGEAIRLARMVHAALPALATRNGGEVVPDF